MRMPLPFYKNVVNACKKRNIQPPPTRFEYGCMFWGAVVVVISNISLVRHLGGL